jgi:hypothetical protein
VFAELFINPPAVRLEIVEQLLRDGDELALRVLAGLAVAPGDPSGDVRWAVAEGLAGFANPGAVTILEQIARTDPDDTVRTCAIGALAERARLAGAAKPRLEAAAPEPITRTRGSVRTRGAGPVRRASPEAKTILDLLKRIRETESSDYVKQMTDLTLDQLGN